eukprot:358826-Chlamydomonas_euryale.AAC.9
MGGAGKRTPGTSGPDGPDAGPRLVHFGFPWHPTGALPRGGAGGRTVPQRPSTHLHRPARSTEAVAAIRYALAYH